MTLSVQHGRRSRSSATRDTVVAHLMREIRAGLHPVGAALPPVRTLADRFGCSTTPVLAALRVLESKGVVDPGPASASPRVVDVGAVPREPDAEGILVLCREAGASRGAYSHLSSGLDQAVFDQLLTYPGVQTRFAVLTGRTPYPEFAAAIRACRTQRPRVVVFGSLMLDDARKIRDLRGLVADGIPVVYPVAHLECKGCHTVISDFAQGQSRLTRYLLERGHRHILRFRVPGDPWFEQQKTLGFEEAMATVGVNGETCRDRTLTVPIPLSIGKSSAENRRAMLDQLTVVRDQHPEATAIMAVNDVHVALLRHTFRTLGVPPPVITGYDAFWNEHRESFRKTYGLSDHDLKPPASVDRNLPEVGRQLVDLAHELLDDPSNLCPRTRTVAQRLDLFSE